MSDAEVIENEKAVLKEVERAINDLQFDLPRGAIMAAARLGKLQATIKADIELREATTSPGEPQ